MSPPSHEGNNYIMHHWKDYPSAPSNGAFIGNLPDISQGATTLELNTKNGNFPLILVKIDGNIYAYVNICPHHFLPLDYRYKKILSRDGEYLVCSAHGAKFDCKTGRIKTDKLTTHEMVDCLLHRVPLNITTDGKITIAHDK
ncbi:MAG: (2Fe-2S)-binding protein [Hyphomicrobiales bacterium]|nr:MAG: (2Fe-2S)-binding protein [Hyphomicrobiales bacterium]